MRQHLSIVLRIMLSKRNSCNYSPYMNNYWTEKHIEYIIHCFGNYSPLCTMIVVISIPRETQNSRETQNFIINSIT